MVVVGVPFDPSIDPAPQLPPKQHKMLQILHKHCTQARRLVLRGRLGTETLRHAAERMGGFQHGFPIAEHHVWQYLRLQTSREQAAARIEMSAMAALCGESAAAALAAIETRIEARDEEGNATVMTYENLLIARKPTASDSLG